MMKHISKLLLLATVAFSGAGCYEDKGNYEYGELSAFYVDTQGLKTTHTVPIFSQLELKSGLVYDGDRENLEFTWMAYTYNTKTGNEAILSEKENISDPVWIMPGNYTLEFRALEKTTGRIATFQHSLTVESSGSGILVLYKENGLTDCALITPKVLFGNISEDVIAYNMYTLANPEHKLTGDPVTIGMYRDNNFQHISIFTEDDGVRISPVDMAVTQTFNQFFQFVPSIVKPEAYIAPCGITSTTSNFESSDGMEYLVNNGALYGNVILFGFGSVTYYGERTMTGGYSATPFVLQGSGSMVSYDTNSSSIISASILSTALTKVSGELGAIDKNLIYMGYGYGAQYAVNAIFKDKNQDKFHFYVMNMLGNVLMNKWDISAYTQIANATSFAFGRRAQLAYYATGRTIYQIKYDLMGNTIQTDALVAWPGLASDETITALKLCPHPGRELSYNAREKYLFVASYSESAQEGKVYVLEVNIETDGSLKTEPVAVYEGFGKIKDFAFKF